MASKQNNDSIVSYIAATAPALLQLIAVVSVGLINVLKLDYFVLAPGFINIANFLTVLLSVSIISLASFWDYNKFVFLKKDQNIFDLTKGYWKVLKVFFVLTLVGIFMFVGILLNKAEINKYVEIWTFVQWSSYIISMVSVSFIIYAYALLKIQEKNNKILQENYIPRLLDSLRRNGHVKDPDIIIEMLDREKNYAIVRFTDTKKYEVNMDFTGEMISIAKVKVTDEN